MTGGGQSGGNEERRDQKSPQLNVAALRIRMRAICSFPIPAQMINTDIDMNCMCVNEMFLNSKTRAASNFSAAKMSVFRIGFSIWRFSGWVEPSS